MEELIFVYEESTPSRDSDSSLEELVFHTFDSDEDNAETSIPLPKTSEPPVDKAMELPSFGLAARLGLSFRMNKNYDEEVSTAP